MCDRIQVGSKVLCWWCDGDGYVAKRIVHPSNGTFPRRPSEQVGVKACNICAGTKTVMVEADDGCV